MFYRHFKDPIILLVVQKSQTTTWDGAKTLVNNGISTTNNKLRSPQLVSLPDFCLPSTVPTKTPKHPKPLNEDPSGV